MYRRAHRHANALFERLHQFPKEERDALTDQIPRSARAVPALLGEAWARPRYRAAFVNNIIQALGEALETQAWLDHAPSCGYLDENEYECCSAAWNHVGAMHSGMIQRADGFCNSSS